MPDATPARWRAMARAVLAHYRQHARDLPWRHTRDPYAIWVSEIMCQQTRVATAIPYWQRWMARFPTVQVLADAPSDDVLAAWAGLGYYSRARNLQRGAQTVTQTLGGRMPATATALQALPGVGRYTAGAIASIAFAERAPIVDGNVIRLLARALGIADDPKRPAGAAKFWHAATALVQALDEPAPGDLNQGLMELGATVCTPTSPQCQTCPLAKTCVARATDQIDALPALPARPSTKALPLIARIAVLIEDADGRVLLGKNPSRGLFAGLWEVPQGEDAAAIAAALGVDHIQLGARLGEHAQVLSHRRLHLRLHRATAPALGNPRDSRYDDLAWVAPVDLTTRGLAAATTALLTETNAWNRIPKRSRSSAKASKKSSKASATSATKPTTKTTPKPRRARPKASTSSASTKRR